MSKFIPIKQLQTLRDSAKSGDERAVKILSSFRDGEDFSALLEEYFSEPAPNVLDKMEEVGEKATNNALTDVAIEKENPSSLVEFIEALIADENEAIEGYDKAILYVANDENDRNVLSVLNEIKNDEIRHIKMLKELIE